MGNTAIEAYKQVLNEKTDAGEYIKPICWKASQNMADLCGEGIQPGDTLVWDPETRKLIRLTGGFEH